MTARRLLGPLALAGLLAGLPLTCRLALPLAVWAAPEAPADPFLEEMGALDREYSRYAEAASDEAAREKLRRLRNERARAVYHRHGHRWHGAPAPEDGGRPSGLSAPEQAPRTAIAPYLSRRGLGARPEASQPGSVGSGCPAPRAPLRPREKRPSPVGAALASGPPG
jgi:hypothetical protein